MKLVPRDEIIFEKVQKRKQLDFIEYSCNGDMIHIGKISRGCRGCFLKDGNNNGVFALYTGCECNVGCGYCYYDMYRNDKSWDTLNNDIIPALTSLYNLTKQDSFKLREMSFNSNGETLKYMDVIREGSMLKKIKEKNSGYKTYSFLYTNGILATPSFLKELKSLGIDELRFHISASGFDKKVLSNLEKAKKLGFIITVEEPSLLENKVKIMSLLKYFNDIGLDHLNLIECQVTEYNFNYLNEKYPEGRYYKDFLWQLYDEGMVYDIMEDVYNNKYKYSVMDCNSKVESVRKTGDDSLIEKDYITKLSSIEGSIKEYP